MSYIVKFELPNSDTCEKGLPPVNCLPPADDELTAAISGLAANSIAQAQAFETMANSMLEAMSTLMLSLDEGESDVDFD